MLDHREGNDKAVSRQYRQTRLIRKLWEKWPVEKSGRILDVSGWTNSNIMARISGANLLIGHKELRRVLQTEMVRESVLFKQMSC